MEEKNPLEPTPTTQPKRFLRSNASGRPTSEKAIKFTPQPKSIISRLLRQVRKQNCVNIKKVSLNAILNISNSSSNTHIENELNSKNNPIQEKPQIRDTCLDIQENYAVELEDDNDNFKYSIAAEEQCKDKVEVQLPSDISELWRWSQISEQCLYCHSDNKVHVQINTTSHWDKKCEEPNLHEITCHVCTHRSRNLQAHRKHLSIHRNQPYACNFPDCNYTCKLSCNLIKHKRIHTSEKPFLCDQCTFRSNFINSLKVHKRIHTSERPYGCKLCSYRCNSSSNLKKHCQHKHRNIS